MSDAVLDARNAEPSNTCPSSPTPAPAVRFFGLDGVRATAMLLGVFYHLPIAFMAGGFGMGFGFGPNPKTAIDNWLHSFRMPLFFLISGFFANMMLGKYGLRRYLTRRWWRIGAPLFLAFFALVGLRTATEYFRPTQPPAFGPPAAGNANFGPALGPFNVPGTRTAPGPGPFGGPAGAAPTAGPFGGPAPTGGPPVGFGGPAAAGGQAVGPAAPPMMPPMMPLPTFPSRAWADSLFGAKSRHFNLEHLWFLWYLLVFVTIAPAVVKLFSWLFARVSLGAIDRVGRRLMHFNVLALVFGVATLPALLHARGFMGWSLANPIGFLAPFPDFLFQYYADEPYYLLYFLAGWWLFRLRDGLPDLARLWLWNLVLGIAAFAASQNLSSTYAFRTNAPGYSWIRLGTFALYGVGAAYTASGFIGFFQKYLDRPTRLGRYFADTALWIYLVHLPLIPYLIWWIQPASGAWWSSSLAGMVLVTGVSLVLFELLVRPTPLVHIFGPPTPRRPGFLQPETADQQPAVSTAGP